MSSYDDFLVDSSSVVLGEVITTGQFGYSVAKGFCKSLPVYVKSVSGR